MTPTNPPLLLVVGATASGKSELAVELALRLDGEIVSADSMQVYRGLDAATAKPGSEARERVTHHLLDVVDPGQDFSMGEFVRRADRAIGDISKSGRLPVVAGGTGLYIRALLRGVFDAPPRDERLRSRLRRIAERRGSPALHALLARVDCAAAAKIMPGDPQRIVRALEIYLITRRPMSEHVRESGFGPERYRAVKIGLTLPREVLYRRIDERVGRFFELGLFEETRTLLASGAPADANAFKALGYREALAVLRGEMTEEDALALIRRNTRRYAKRQLTWFRKEEGIAWIDGDRPLSRIADEAEAIARQALGRARP